MKLNGSELKRGDYISLGKAVAKFNRTINKLKSEENKVNLPETIDYREISERIVTKNELDRYVKNLRSFTESEAQEIYETEAGENITYWERNILENERKEAIKRMSLDLKKNVNKYDKDTIDTLKYNIKVMKNLETLTKNDFKDAVRKIHRLGASDYAYRRALQFRENFYIAFESISNYQYYDKFKKRLDRYKDPFKFYEFIRKSEFFKDIFKTYVRGKGIVYVVGNFDSGEEAFNYALENDYGIELKYKYSLISENGTILAEGDNKFKLNELIKKSTDNKFKNAKIVVNE